MMGRKRLRLDPEGLTVGGAIAAVDEAEEEVDMTMTDLDEEEGGRYATEIGPLL